jgi:Bacterial Ig domain
MLLAAMLAVAIAGCGPGREFPAPVEPTPDTIATVPATFSVQPDVLYVDSGQVRVGVDRRWGGAIREIWLGGQNIVNNNDGGRLIGVSVYDLALPQRTSNPLDTGWNATPSDWHNSINPPFRYSFAGNSLYVKSRNIQWYPENWGGGPGHPITTDLVVETWISFVAADMIRLRYRIAHEGSDLHALTSQEFPFAYIRTPYPRFVCYDGASPWTNDAVHIDQTAPVSPRSGVSVASEHWGSFVNAADVGLTVWAPQAYDTFLFQAFQEPGGPENSTNYLRPVSYWELPPQSSWETEVFVFAGRWQDARKAIYHLHRTNQIPDVMPGFGMLDVPAPLATLSGTVDVAGWAFDDRGITKVDIYIDGTPVGQASYGSPRPDVANDYPNMTPALNSGFQFRLDTTTMSNGQHELQIHAVDAAGNQAVVVPRSTTITINN